MSADLSGDPLAARHIVILGGRGVAAKCSPLRPHLGRRSTSPRPLTLRARSADQPVVSIPIPNDGIRAGQYLRHVIHGPHVRRLLNNGGVARDRTHSALDADLGEAAARWLSTRSGWGSHSLVQEDMMTSSWRLRTRSPPSKWQAVQTSTAG